MIPAFFSANSIPSTPSRSKFVKDKLDSMNPEILSEIGSRPNVGAKWSNMLLAIIIHYATIEVPYFIAKDVNGREQLSSLSIKDATLILAISMEKDPADQCLSELSPISIKNRFAKPVSRDITDQTSPMANSFKLARAFQRFLIEIDGEFNTSGLQRFINVTN